MRIILTVILCTMAISHGLADVGELNNAAQKKNLADFTCKQSKKIIETQGFKSREQLLQLFYNGYYSGEIRNIRVSHTEAVKIGNSISTLFPIKNCDSITFSDSILELSFAKQQKIGIPGTFGQAHLIISREIAFHLEPDPNDTTILKFKIIRGTVNLKISKLMTLFNSTFENMIGTEMFYKSDSQKRISILGLHELIEVPRRNIQVSGDTNAIFVDLNHPRLEGKNKLIAMKNEMRIFNILFSLRGNDSISYNHSAWKRDTVSSTQIRYTIDAIRKGFIADTLFPGGLLVSKTALYQLEKRSISLSTGFNLLK